MRILGVLFYVTVISLIGVAFIAFSFNKIQPAQVNDVLVYIKDSANSRLIVGLVGVLLILISYSFAQLILNRFQREKTIAFSTSSGKVTISLSAVEDLIRRMSSIMPEIKELRPNVIATKKGIRVDLRVTLKSEANIPELTSRLEEIVKSKLTEVLGLEEQVFVNTHVAKISLVEDKKKKETEKQDPGIPFSGYGRV
jgi:uncharacterized alkaline shock family protein YloU